MFKVILKKDNVDNLIYTSDSEFDAMNVAIRNTQTGTNAIIKDDFGVIYETFSKEDVDHFL